MTRFITSFSMFNFCLSEVNLHGGGSKGFIDPCIPPTIENLRIFS